MSVLPGGLWKPVTQSAMTICPLGGGGGKVVAVDTDGGGATAVLLVGGGTSPFGASEVHAPVRAHATNRTIASLMKILTQRHG